MKRRFTLRDLRDAVPGSRPGAPYTVRELARMANVSPGHLSHVENGTDVASPRLLWRLSQALVMPYAQVWDAYQETRRKLAPADPAAPPKTTQRPTRPKAAPKRPRK